MTSQKSCKDLVTEHFYATFGKNASIIARAPGRVEVLGNHTDYNEGVVLSAAIDREVWIALDRSGTDTCGLSSTHFADTVFLKEIVPQKGINSWVNYPLGVYKIMQDRGFAAAPFNMAIHSTVPLGAGVSSSAALEVGTAIALCSLFDLSIDPVDLAKIGQKAENSFVGANCGLLDQFSSMFGKAGHLLYIDFRSLAHETIPLAASDVTVAITLSGVTHALVAGEYNSRRRECSEAARFFTSINPGVKALRDVTMKQLLASEGRLNPQAFKRAMHVVGEDERVMKGMDLLKKGLLPDFGKLLYQSHDSSTDNFQNSCKELDLLVAITKTIDGVYGARLTGGGFGGAMLTMLKTEAQDSFRETVLREYKKQTGRETVVHFAKIADGAKILQ